MSLEAMKAAREWFEDEGTCRCVEGLYCCGRCLTVDLLDAAIQREEGGGEERPDCTGIAASWCPNCGYCTCQPTDGGFGPEEDNCPLHGIENEHAEPTPTPPSGVVSREAVEETAREVIDSYDCGRDQEISSPKWAAWVADRLRAALSAPSEEPWPSLEDQLRNERRKHELTAQEAARWYEALKRQEAVVRLVEAGREDVWLWQGDGTDDPASLSCPVVMEASTLRCILSAAPSEPMVTRARAMEAVLWAHTWHDPNNETTPSQLEFMRSTVAEILDGEGEARDGE